jgi:DNA-binding transcriptional MerR regulator
MPTDTPYSIADLARLTGVNVRTIRYYLAQGLLPASGESGPGAHYGEGHLDRLRLTRRLQQQHLPLAEIRRQLAEMTDDEVAGVLAAPLEPAQTPTGSALDYVRAVLGQQARNTPSPPAAPARALLRRTAGYARMGMVSEPAEMTTTEVADAAAFLLAPALARNAAPTTEPPITEPPAPERSQWERLSLGPNVELNIRRPLSRIEQRRVERLITIARQVLKEDAK